MTTVFSVNVNEKQLETAIQLFEFVGGNTTKAIRWAINKTLPIAKTRSARAIYDSINLKSNEIKKRIEVDNATVQKLKGRLFMSPKGLSLQRYEYGGAKVSFIGDSRIVTPDSRIRVKIKRQAGSIKDVTGQGRRGVTGEPFYFLTKYSNELAIGMFGDRPGPKGGKIKILYGPSVSQLFDDVKEDPELEFNDLYRTQLIDQMKRVLRLQYPG